MAVQYKLARTYISSDITKKSAIKTYQNANYYGNMNKLMLERGEMWPLIGRKS